MPSRARDQKLPPADAWLMIVASSVATLGSIALARRMPRHLAQGFSFFIAWSVAMYFMRANRAAGRGIMRRLLISVASGAAGGLVAGAVVYLLR